MNPYLVPGMDERPGGPLCPYAHPEHEDYYVEVDDTFKAYEEFQAKIGALSRLVDDGRLVVALGPERCGKSSLLNRCANWAKAELEQNGFEGMILPLTEECPLDDGVDKRERHIFQRVVDELSSLDLFSIAQFEELLRRKEKEDLSLGYGYLGNVIRNRRPTLVLIILLPQSELAIELNNYARYARNRHVLFLAESSFLERLDPARHHHTVGLKVGTLREDDGWLFAQARQALHADEPNAPDYPKVSEETMGMVTDGWEVSIGQLQDLLYGVYREILEQPEREDSTLAFETGEVSFTQILKFHFRRVRNQARIYE